MANELVAKTAGELEFIREEKPFGTDEVSAADIRISRVLLAQKMSPITDKKGAGIAAGDMWDSVSETLLTKQGEMFSFVPVHIFKTLTVQEMKNGKFEFKEARPWKPEYANIKWEDVVDGIAQKNIENINILAIKESDLGNPAALPVILSFRSTSLNCGKDIVADCLQAKARGASSAQLTISVFTEMTTNDKRSYYVFKKKAPRLTKDYVANKAVFENWHQMFTSGKALVDDEAKAEAQLKDGFTEFTGQF